jgi:hypothetical protein
LQQQNQLDLKMRAEQDFKDRLDRMEGKIPLGSLSDVDLKNYELDRASAMRHVETEAFFMRQQQEQYLASQQRAQMMFQAEDSEERFRRAQAMRQAGLMREEQHFAAPQHQISPMMRQAQMARQLDNMHAAQSQSAGASTMGYPRAFGAAAAAYGGPVNPMNPMGNPYM